ncbi:hypothetical protein CYY_009041, partial [Polysphondylium violaceum]
MLLFIAIFNTNIVNAQSDEPTVTEEKGGSGETQQFGSSIPEDASAQPAAEGSSEPNKETEGSNQPAASSAAPAEGSSQPAEGSTQGSAAPAEGSSQPAASSA